VDVRLCTKSLQKLKHEENDSYLTVQLKHKENDSYLTVQLNLAFSQEAVGKTKTRKQSYITILFYSDHVLA